MKREFLVGSLCATALTITAALSVVSCSNDDEYYEDSNYTLANKRVTRGNPETGFYTLYKNENVKFSDELSCNVSASYSVSHFGGGTIAINSVSNCDFYRIGYTRITNTSNIVNVDFEIDVAKIKPDESNPDSIKYDTIIYSKSVTRKYPLTMFRFQDY